MWSPISHHGGDSDERWCNQNGNRKCPANRAANYLEQQESGRLWARFHGAAYFKLIIIQPLRQVALSRDQTVQLILTLYTRLATTVSGSYCINYGIMQRQSGRPWRSSVRDRISVLMRFLVLWRRRWRFPSSDLGISIFNGTIAYIMMDPYWYV